MVAVIQAWKESINPSIGASSSVQGIPKNRELAWLVCDIAGEDETPVSGCVMPAVSSSDADVRLGLRQHTVPTTPSTAGGARAPLLWRLRCIHGP